VPKSLNVLIVDDSATMRAMIKRAVQLSGADVASIHEAGNGREALATLETQPIDAVFTDLNMPVMSGTELLREMRARDWSHILRVIVSTDGSAARKMEVRDLDVRLYIDKPFAPEVIRDVLSELSAAAASCP
jgi:two-component system, chemotaxis family, chemotaxis protein CheY